MIATQRSATTRTFPVGRVRAKPSTTQKTRNFTGSFLVRGLNDDHFQFLELVPVTVQPIDASYVASFRDANIHASGGTFFESIVHVMSMITDVFAFLLENEHHLGPEPKRQLDILKNYVAKMEC